MPAEAWRTIPARSMSWCEAICASAGTSFSVGRKNRVLRMVRRTLGDAAAEGNAVSARTHPLAELRQLRLGIVLDRLSVEVDPTVDVAHRADIGLRLVEVALGMRRIGEGRDAERARELDRDRDVEVLRH